MSEAKSITLTTLKRRVRDGQKIPMLTCYDATMASWLERGGVDVLLVGDTAAEMMLGHAQTIFAPLDYMILITAAVKRAVPRCFVMGDMPFMSYQADHAEAIRNAGRFLTDGLADAVKLEVDLEDAALVGKLAHAGIPVVAHLGARPQQARRVGGYKAAGRTADDAQAIVNAAIEMEQRGAVMLLLEATTEQVAREVVERTALPVFGCGAGPACHGHVVVTHDLLGMTDWQPPFAPPLASIGAAIQGAASDWAARVQDGRYPCGDQVYRMNESEQQRLKR